MGFPQDFLPFVKYERHQQCGSRLEFLMERNHDAFIKQLEELDELFSVWLEENNKLARLISIFTCLPSLIHKTLYYAIYYERIELLQFMLSHKELVQTYYGITNIAAMNDKQIVMKFLIASNYVDMTYKTLHWTCRQGHFEMLKLVHPHVLLCGPSAMDLAAENGHFQIVNYLHHHRLEGCTTRAMDSAASSGHLNIVKFLHQHRSEGCTTRALDSAAGNGHFEIVKFLTENRHEGGTTSAMTLAACRGYLDIVKYLCQNRTEGCTVRALEGSVENNHLHVHEYLTRNQHTYKLSTSSMEDHIPIILSRNTSQSLYLIHSMINTLF